MCGRFVQLPVIDFGQPGLADLAPGLSEIQPSYNLAPTQRASVILDRGEGRRVTRLAWGLLPFWAKAKGLQGSTINARIETVATKPAFRSAFKKRRCVIPMSGYYEWSVSPEDGKKDPWFIHATGPLLAAGLWEDTSPLLPDGNLGTFTIITGDSSGVSADIHDRMPVWLQAGQIDEWMAASPDEAMAMLLASEPPAMEAYRVSRAVNTPRNNREDLLQQVA
nr:SOS response-associated peptidase [Stenotrophomonas pavanii]